MKLKYIMTKDDGVIMFSNLITHTEMARKFGGATSAGFVTIDKNYHFETYGESVSLRMKPAEDDNEKIERQLR